MDKKYTILIVEDDEISREILSDILKPYARILGAGDGSKAIHAIEKRKDDLDMILLDLNMPGIDGFAVLNVMKNEGLLDKIPVVVISGEIDDSSIKQCFDYGIVDFLTKPFKEEVVASRINHLIDLYSHGDPEEKAILIVDDEPINRYVLNDMLNDNFKIYEVSGGADAIKIMEAKKDSLGLILLDLNMPVINGFDVLEDMGKTGLIKKIPVIIISDEKDENIQAACFRLGISDFISKPYRKDIVRHRVNNCIELNLYRKSLERKLENRIAEIKAQNRALLELTKNLKNNGIAYSEKK